ncbi:MAG: L-rhamnose isomerase [Clostridiales bacterium]|jgi:L-rhamnose isomerase|nr:L-rhamnose isomerase [Clostridiales bacterium]
MDIKSAYDYARQVYGKLGVDTDAAIERVKNIPISMHCWQGDDVRGFENPEGDLTGGIQTTGNYPGRATTIAQLKADFEKAASYIPGKKRISLHAIYLDNLGEKVERDAIEYKHFAGWVEWAKEKGFGIDFNPTFFSHPLSADGLTLSHPDPEVRKFWINHGIACRKIAEEIGRELGNTVITNYWIPDGFKDIPVDRYAARARLVEAYDEIFAGAGDRKYNRNAVESKLFGIGAESCTIGSHEFYMGYASTRKGILLTLDAGHFHPTEVISDKISSALLFCDEILLHVSRPVRWDSDHVVIFDDELKNIALEILRGNFEDRVHVGLDFFDASINRIAAWVIGTRNMQKALLYAALEPTEKLKSLELEGDFTSRLALLEELKSYPFQAVWDWYCETEGVPVRDGWLDGVKAYERDVLSAR